MPIAIRPSERSCSVAYALASTVGSRVAGFVTKWPSLIVEVSRAATASIGTDSCHRTCESYVHAYPKPCRSASWISSSQRENGGSGRTVTPKSMSCALLLAVPLSLPRSFPPVHRPEKIVCVGQNYRAHLSEMQGREVAEPTLFGKFAATVIGDGDEIVLPPESSHVDAEAELAVVIGKAARRVSREQALEFVAGYVCANDVSARDIQYAGDRQWFRGKNFET